MAADLKFVSHQLRDLVAEGLFSDQAMREVEEARRKDSQNSTGKKVAIRPSS
jgi:hypothetical protein